VVRDVIKAYYDKKAKKTEGQFTAESAKPGSGSARAAALIAPRVPALKEDETAGRAPGESRNE
jgi:hypothetical protein